MSLTNVYYLVCLGITINCVLVTNCLQQAIALLCGSGWCGCSWQTTKKESFIVVDRSLPPSGRSIRTYLHRCCSPFSLISLLLPPYITFILIITNKTKPNIPNKTQPNSISGLSHIVLSTGNTQYRYPSRYCFKKTAIQYWYPSWYCLNGKDMWTYMWAKRLN